MHIISLLSCHIWYHYSSQEQSWHTQSRLWSCCVIAVSMLSSFLIVGRPPTSAGGSWGSMMCNCTMKPTMKRSDIRQSLDASLQTQRKIYLCRARRCHVIFSVTSGVSNNISILLWNLATCFASGLLLLIWSHGRKGQLWNVEKGEGRWRLVGAILVSISGY